MMSGTIAVNQDTRWSAAGWLFDWTVELLADNVTDPDLAKDLREIVEENLGWLGLGDFGPDAERQLRTLIQQRLVTEADKRLPDSLANRPAVLDLLRDLVTMSK
jgi:hypothetical protein